MTRKGVAAQIQYGKKEQLFQKQVHIDRIRRYTPEMRLVKPEPRRVNFFFVHFMSIALKGNLHNSTL